MVGEDPLQQSHWIATKDNGYESVLNRMDTMDPPSSLFKWKYNISKIDNQLDRHHNEIAVDKARMNQNLDPYELYPGFQCDGFEGQDMGYDDNYFRIVS